MKPYIFGKGICRWCQREVALNKNNTVRAHPCEPHPIGYAQGNERPARVIRAYRPGPDKPDKNEVDHFWHRAGFGL